jgi:hypothetical protein
MGGGLEEIVSQMPKRQRVAIIGGLLVSAIALWFAFHGLHLGDVWLHIREAHIGWLLLGVLLFFMSMTLIAWRWGFLLRDFGLIPTAYLTGLVSICYMGNNVYPLRAGEFLRIFLLQRDYRVPVVRTTTTIFIERIFDGVIMLGFIVIPLQFINVDSQALRLVFTATTIFFVVALAAFVVLALRPDLLRTLAHWSARLLPDRIGHIALKLSQDVTDGMAGLRNPRYLLGMVVGSIATWLFNASVYWAVAVAFDIHVEFLVMLVVCGAVNLAGVLPASPGQIGVFEASVKTVLAAVGVREDLATAYAVVVHVVIWLPPTVLGFALLARRGLGVNALIHQQQAPFGA